jgi:hypothetical protein
VHHHIAKYLTLCLAALLSLRCSKPAAPPPHSYAIYGEYARGANKLMQPNLNRRVFNKVEAHAGPDITLNSDGCITVLPGTYRLTGFSTVTMQTTFAPPQPAYDNNYPGYCLVYDKAAENSGQAMLANAIAIGSPTNAQDLAPSLFDAIHTFAAKTDVCVGHQAGADLHDEVYLSVYEVNGTPSDYHAVARIAITRM